MGKPRAFISHDSRDKTSIAEPIALQLMKFMCTVWYDEFSLHVGDSLSESIEKGLKECRKCILVLTPNFLSDEGWSKREYDSIFTRRETESHTPCLA
jgi:predicted nucleotide-binding protein